MARGRAHPPPDGPGGRLSAWLGALGAALLAASVLPQGWRILRSWRVDDFGWPFVLLNLVGLLLLATRSGELGEGAFVAVNLLGAAFWLLVMAVKAWQAANPSRPRAPAVS